MTDQEAAEHAALNALAEDIVKVAQHLAPGYGLDPIATAMATGFAMTKMLFRAAPGPDQALVAVQVANESALKAVADMISGANATHQVTQ